MSELQSAAVQFLHGILLGSWAANALSSAYFLCNFAATYYASREQMNLFSLPATKMSFIIIPFCKTKRPLKVLFCQNERLHCLQRYTMLWQITYVCCSHVPIWCVCVLFYVIHWRDFFPKETTSRFSPDKVLVLQKVNKVSIFRYP